MTGMPAAASLAPDVAAGRCPRLRPARNMTAARTTRVPSETA